MALEKTVVNVAILANFKFSADLYRMLVEPSENMVLSSLNVSSILAMLLAGSRGETKSQIETALYLKSDEVIAGYKEITKRLEALKKDKNLTFRTANRIYIEEKFDVHQYYKNLLEKDFATNVESVTWKPDVEVTRKIINKWVKKQSKKKIKECLPEGMIGDDTEMVIVNYLYFKVDWDIKFLKVKTKVMDFQVDANKTIKVHMMRKLGLYTTTILSKLGFARALRMPLKGESLDMIIFLPEKNISLESFERQLRTFDFTEIEFGREREMHVGIPRCTIESTNHLTNILKDMGMNNLFSEDSSDLSGISQGNLSVSKIIQKVIVEVDEDGGSPVPIPTDFIKTMDITSIFNKPKFICDRPFYFYVQERKSKIILFSGRVVQPIC